MSQVNVELGRAANAPTSLNDAQVRGLAQVAAGQISMSNLLGKTGRFDGVIAINSNGQYAGGFTGQSIFGAILSTLNGDLLSIQLIFAPLSPPVYTGNLKLTNNTTGASCILTQFNQGSTVWINNSPPPNVIRHAGGGGPNTNDNFSITAA